DEFEEVADRIREEITKQAPGADFEFHQLLEDQLNDLSGAPEAIQLAVYGPDQDKLAAIADSLTGELEKVPGVVDTYDGVVDGNETIRVSPITDSPGGLSLGQLSQGLGAAIAGLPAGSVNYEGSSLPARVRLAGNAPGAALKDLVLPDQNGIG